MLPDVRAGGDAVKLASALAPLWLFTARTTAVVVVAAVTGRRV